MYLRACGREGEAYPPPPSPHPLSQFVSLSTEEKLLWFHIKSTSSYGALAMCGSSCNVLFEACGPSLPWPRGAGLGARAGVLPGRPGLLGSAGLPGRQCCQKTLLSFQLFLLDCFGLVPPVTRGVAS